MSINIPPTLSKILVGLPSVVGEILRVKYSKQYNMEVFSDGAYTCMLSDVAVHGSAVLTVRRWTNTTPGTVHAAARTSVPAKPSACGSTPIL